MNRRTREKMCGYLLAESWKSSEGDSLWYSPCGQVTLCFDDKSVIRAAKDRNDHMTTCPRCRR